MFNVKEMTARPGAYSHKNWTIIARGKHSDVAPEKPYFTEWLLSVLPASRAELALMSSLESVVAPRRRRGESAGRLTRPCVCVRCGRLFESLKQYNKERMLPFDAQRGTLNGNPRSKT